MREALRDCELHSTSKNFQLVATLKNQPQPDVMAKVTVGQDIEDLISEIVKQYITGVISFVQRSLS